jgi:hypothetical protein
MSFAPVPDLCPFKMMALGLRHGGRIYVEGGKAMREQEVDLACIGPTCMMFVKTNVRPDGQPIGGCGVAVAPAITKELDRRMERLENTINYVASVYLRDPWYKRLWAWCRLRYLAHQGKKRLPDDNVVALPVVQAEVVKETTP